MNQYVQVSKRTPSAETTSQNPKETASLSAWRRIALSSAACNQAALHALLESLTGWGVICVNSGTFISLCIDRTQSATPPPAEQPLLLLLPACTALTHRMSSTDHLSHSLLSFKTASTRITQRRVSFSSSATAFSVRLHGVRGGFALHFEMFEM